MANEKKYSATFSSNKKDWQLFLKVVSNQDLSASTVLRQYIKKYNNEFGKEIIADEAIDK